jgi:CBS domain-containing protein
VIAVLFAVVGLFGNPFLVLIALFIWMGASQEASMSQIKSALEGISARQVMVTDFTAVSPDAPLQRAVEMVMRGRQQDFPVVENGQLVGMLGHKELVRGLQQRGAESPVSQAMRRDCPVLSASDDLETVLQKLQDTNCRVLPVADRGSLVGLFTVDNMAEFVRLQSALGNRRPARTDTSIQDEKKSA